MSVGRSAPREVSRRKELPIYFSFGTSAASCSFDLACTLVLHASQSGSTAGCFLSSSLKLLTDTLQYTHHEYCARRSPLMLLPMMSAEACAIALENTYL